MLHFIYFSSDIKMQNSDVSVDSRMLPKLQKALRYLLQGQ